MTDETWKPLFLDLTEALKATELDDRQKLAEALKIVGETISGREVKAGPVTEALAEGVIGETVEEEIQPEPVLEETIQVEEPPAEPPAGQPAERLAGPRVEPAAVPRVEPPAEPTAAQAMWCI